MKKSLLFSLACTCGLSLLSPFSYGQDNVAHKVQRGQIDNMPSFALPPATPTVPMEKSRAHNNPSAQSTVVIRTLGQEPNAFGTIGNKQYLWADQSINAITLTHRVLVGSNNGFVAYDMSKDGGATWFNGAGPVYSPDGNPQGPNYSVARYPQGCIYNPVGNTIPDSAFEVYFCPTRDNTNIDNSTSPAGDWGGHGYGVHQLSNLHPPTQHQMHSSVTPVTGLYNLIPPGQFMTKTGMSYNLDDAGKGSANYDYNDTLLMSVGTFTVVAGQRDFAYVEQKVAGYTELDNHGHHIYADAKIAFADNGMTGYVTSLVHPSFTANPDSAYTISVRKTTDGGATWGTAINLDINATDIFLLNNGTKYTTGFEHDIVVDGAGNLHVIVNCITHPAGSAGFSLYGTYPYGSYGIFDIYTTDGGTTWRQYLIRKPWSFGGMYGVSATDATNPSINEYNRVQASRSYGTGNQVFFSWFETDTISWPGVGNTNPDFWAMGYDITTHMWTAAKNFSAGSTADGSVREGMVSYYVLDNGAGTYTVPCAYIGFPSNDITKTGSTESLFYIDQAQFVTADFNVPDGSLPLATGIQEYKQNNLTISQNYPNPFTGTSMVDITLQKGTDVHIEIVNTIGELVSSQDIKNMPTGKNTVTLDGTGLSSGVYFYTIKTNETSITRKMTIK
jgi:hypothetical protein